MDEALSHTVSRALQRLQAELAEATPQMAGPVTDWMRELAGGAEPLAYFSHPMAFPTLQLPGWVAHSLGGGIDAAFEEDLAFSSINGYYFIRMIDNVMDGEATVETRLLPALASFHSAFQGVYQAHFAAEHPFWALYRRVWLGTAEAAVVDARLGSITREAFEEASARKVGAALIPVAAVCHRLGRAEQIAPWAELVHRLGKWHQMLNDSFDWHKDSVHGNTTYFLSEAQRLKHPDESPMAWVVRCGFDGACDTLRGWMHEVQVLAATLGCPPLVQYLGDRAAQFEAQARAARDALRVFGPLATLRR
jgi:hypothetical protein